MAKRRQKRRETTVGQPSERAARAVLEPAGADACPQAAEEPSGPPAIDQQTAGSEAPRSANGALDTDSTRGGFPIVGIGASAGGLDAFKKFFSNMPADSGAAFVLIPHLDPTHESLMVQLLARHTRMPVREAQDCMPVEPNCVYVIPPNKYLGIVDGKLQLSTPADRHGQPTAIDFFFRALADSRQEQAIAIVLSGTSSHGTPGLKKIKLAGGMVMVQQPETAEYDQMPRSAVATGLVDFVLPPEQMPDALVKYVSHPYVRGPREQTAAEASREQLGCILALLKERTKYDFRSYRKQMLTRRVLRRMGLCHLEQMSDYLDYLRDTPEEVTALYQDLLIGVTEFFRDPDAFQVLAQHVIPELVATRDSVRIWVPACASGEEPYSIAMLFLQEFATERKPANLQIFATDIDERSLEAARQGIYSESSVVGVSPERLEKFFTRIDTHYWRANKQLRESITFAQQNLISDAPFSKLDLIVCRNLLIYLEPQVQTKVIRLFHFALMEGGFLLLGPSETTGGEVGLFAPVSKMWRVFRRIGPTRRDVEIPVVPTDERHRLPVARSVAPTSSTATDLRELMQRLVLEHCTPAAALITRNYEILSVLGPLVNYLEFPPGEIVHDLLALARPGLRTRLRAAIHKSVRTGEVVIDSNLRVKRDGSYHTCSVTVRPVAESQDTTGLLLVTLQDREPAGRAAADRPEDRPVGEAQSELLQHLEHELKSTREDMQSTIAEYESATEDLKASNEEVMSMNEELQSANEELETSREELQSLNEELSTVNNQLQDKAEELDRSNSDLINLMASSDVATVILDNGLRIKRFTPPVARLLNLRGTDLERQFSDFAPKFADDALLDDCRTVMEQLVPIEKEVWTRDEALSADPHHAQSLPHRSDSRCYLRRILPYRSADDRIAGVVITFVDISQRIAAEAESRRLAEVLWNSNDAITVHDFEGRIRAWNRSAERMYGYPEAEALQKNVRDIVPGHMRAEALTYVDRLIRNEPVTAFETQRVTKDGRILDVDLTATAYCDERGRPIGVSTTERDITERERIKKLLRHGEQKMRAILAAVADAIITIDPHGVVTSVNPATEQMFGYSQEELIGQNVNKLMPPDFLEDIYAYIARYLQTGAAPFVGNGREVNARHKDGSVFPVEVSVSQVDQLGLFTVVAREISYRKNLEKQVLEIAAAEQRRIGQELHDGTGGALTGLALFAGAIVDLLNQAPTKVTDPGSAWLLDEAVLLHLRQTAERLSQGLVEANQHVKKLSHGIMPVQIESEGLMSALQELAAATDAQKGVSCQFDCPQAVTVADNTIATHLYRIAQEAVNNALRHSQADQIRIFLSHANAEIILGISDNGIGFYPPTMNHPDAAEGTGGFGLGIMGYRASMIGGTLRVHRRKEGGMLVQCAIPRRIICDDSRTTAREDSDHR